MRTHKVQLNDFDHDMETGPIYYTEDLTDAYTEDLTDAYTEDLTDAYTEDLTDAYTEDLTDAYAEDPEDDYVPDPNRGPGENSVRAHNDSGKRPVYRTQRSARSAPSPIRTFLVTLAMILGLGFLFLGMYGYIVSAEKRAAGMGTLEAIAEELIPIVVQEEETVQEENAADNSASAADLTGSEPTASENIVKTPDGTYTLTSTKNADSVTFAFAGDILFDDHYAAAASIIQRGGSAESSFDEQALDIMRSADVFMLNNEFPYSTRGTATEGKTYTFRADPGTANWLKEIGVDIVSLANNHAYDYGEEALLDTIDTLDGIGMIHVGAGRNLDEASRTAYFNINGMTVAILNATQIEQGDYPDTKGATADSAGVFRCWDDTELLAKIREAETKADYTIVYIHWGTEKMSTPDYNQTSRQQGMADAGADLIIGDHPHVLQPFARVGNTMVVYSLGNYLFTSYDTDTGIFEVTLQPSAKTVTGMRFIPMLQTNCSVRTLDGAEKERVLTEIRSGSAGVNIDADGSVTLSN